MSASGQKKRNRSPQLQVRLAEITKELIDMPVNAALFIFLAAIVVSVFAFLSISVWITVPARERQARDRSALLKTLAEHPGENVTQILALLQKEDQARAARSLRDKRRSWVESGIILIAVGLGLAGMMMLHGGSGNNWSVGLIPLLLGLAMIAIGIFRNHTTKQE
jgi:Domain of unknown function (DUF6249)